MYSNGPSRIFSFSCDQLFLAPCPTSSPSETGSGPGGLEDEETNCSLLLGLGAIQMLSGTGFNTALVGENPMLRPVELLRGGMAFGDWKFSAAIMAVGIGG